MKKILVLFVGVIIISGMLGACRKNISCFNAQAYQLQFYTYSVADTIRDTGATVYQYTGGSHFLALLDSIPGLVLRNALTYYTGRFAQQYIDYTGYDSDIYHRDIMIVLYPSGNVYKLSDMGHDNRKMSERSNQNYACTDNITYIVNDSAYECPAQTYNAGSVGLAILNIRY